VGVSVLLGKGLTVHLVYEKHDSAGRGSGDSRNGSTSKTLLTDVGAVDLEVPRDRRLNWALGHGPGDSGMFGRCTTDTQASSQRSKCR
jgi:hypothetical protein